LLQLEGDVGRPPLTRAYVLEGAPGLDVLKNRRQSRV